jgi:uncharacterized membrane protein
LQRYKQNLAFILTFLFIPLFTNVKRSWDMFLNTVDFSIYQQALYEIAAGNSWNPYLTIRNVNVLNDHFDPAIYLGALWVWLFGESVTGLMIFEWLWFFFGALSLYWINRNETFDYKSALFVMFAYTFSRGALQGVEFPIHPTTWSIVPCIWAVYYLIKGEYKKFIPMFLFLCLFREMYYFALSGVAVYFFLKKEWLKSALSLFGFGVLVVILLKVRPWLVGPTVEYDNGTMQMIFGFQIVAMFKKIFEMTYPWQIFAPALFLIPLGYFHAEDRKKYLDQFLRVLFFILPGFCLHILVGRMVHHQSIPFSIPLYVFLAMQNWNWLFKKKKLFYFSLVFIILCCSSRYTRMVKHLVMGSKVTKIDFDGKRKSFREVEKVINALPEGLDIIATGSVVPFIVKAGRKVYQFCNNGPFLNKYDVVIVEKNRQLIANPLNFDQVDEVERDCRAMADKVLYEDYFNVVFKGNMTQECTKHTKYWGSHPIFVPKNRK